MTKKNTEDPIMTETEQQLTEVVKGLGQRLQHARRALKEIRTLVDKAIKENTGANLP